MNSVNLIGNIGHDLELRHTGTGKAVLNFNIAVQSWQKDESGKNKTDWFRVVVWNKLAENVANYCGKGSKVGISGSLGTNSYTDSSGQQRTNVEITAQSVDFMDKPSTKLQTPQSRGANSGFERNDEAIDIQDDDLPF